MTTVFSIIRNLVICSFLLFVSHTAISQSISVSASNLFLPCGGGSIQLDAVGTTSSTIFGDDFNAGVLTSGWTTGPAAQFNNPCGAALDGSTYLWMGPGTSAPRELVTSNLDVSCGGTICFDFKFMCEYCGDSAPCEGADFYNEGVSLQYSTNGGTVWTDIAYFAPNGNLLTNYPGAGASSPVAFGATNFTTWDNYCFAIPAGAFTATTQFRLFQWGSSGSNYDHWGIDNFIITTIPCSPFYYDWEHLPGFPDAASITANVTTTTTFIAHYTDGTITYTDSVTVDVDNLEIDVVTITPETCYGVNDASISTTMVNGVAPFTYNLSGPVTSSNSTGTFNNLQAGLYVLQISDNSGCNTSYNFTMPSGPSCCVVTATGVNPTCNGFTDGSIQSIPSGGIPAYTYQWYDISNVPLAGQVSQSLSNVGDGTYIVEITDISGCVNRDTVTLAAPTALGGNLQTSQINCYGLCDASVEFTGATGGVPNYSYSLNGGSYQASGLFSNLCQGNYTVTLKDGNNCTTALSSTVTEPTDLFLVDTLINNEICNFGAADGEIYIEGIGGTPGYTYDIGGTINNTGIYTGLTSGTYMAYVTDLAGCTDSLQVVLPLSVGPNPVIDYQQDVLCAGGINGVVVIVVSISTGTPPFLYDLNNTGAAPSNTFNVNAGNHTVDVYDANNCTGSVSFSISQPTVLSYTTTQTDALCNTSCDGTITVNASGATPPYEYSSDGGLSFQTSNVLTNLCPGNINVLVRDANGCLANSVVNIGSPPALSSSHSFVDPTCYNGCDGSITFGLTSGGTGPYTYSIDNGQTYQNSPFFINLCAGIYDLIARDANGCEFLMSGVSLTNPAQITFNDINNVSSNCGFNNGSFEVQAQNGVGAYTYTIDNGVNTQPTGNFTNLFSGLYTVIATDANGCQDSTEEAISDLEIQTALDSTHDVTCYGGTDGGVWVSIVNGLPPINFTLDSIYFQNTGDFDGMMNPSVELAAGTHFVIIHDSGNCSDFYEFVINQPDSITYVLNTTNTSCIDSNNATITFTNVLGGDGGPYSYSIDSGATYQNSNLFTGLAPGVYNTIAMDGNGCTSGMQVTIGTPDSINISLNPNDLLCYGVNSGSLIVVAQGGSGPYSYDIGTANNTTGIFTMLAAGNYNITVTDNNGCVKDTMQVINQPDTITVALTVADNLCFGDCGGQVIAATLGGTPPYLYSGDNGVSQQSSDTITDLCAGIHTIQVEDFNNCTYTVNQVISDPADLQLNLVGVNSICGTNNGSITANEMGGTGPFEYAISTDNGITFSAPSSVNLFSNLAPGYYIVKVIDFNLCETEESIILTGDPLPTIDFIQTTDILCNGDTDGQIIVTSGLGVGVHTYSINSVDYFANDTFMNLAAGNYDVYVQDGNGCIVQSSTVISEPPALVNNPSVTNLTCNGNFTGEISIVPVGGSPNYQYSIDNGTSYQSFGLYSNLAANAYTTIVADNNGCTDTVIVNITEPTPLDTNVSITNVTCFGDCDGAIDLDPSGGTAPLTFQWTGNIAGVNDPVATNVCAGLYDAIITDGNGCILNVQGLQVSEPPLLSITNVLATDDSCYNACGGIIEINSPTATVFEITNNGNSTTNATGIFNALCEGNYDVLVTDAAGCTATSNTTISGPDSLQGMPPSNWTNICFGTDINVTSGFTQGGTPPYNFDWVDSDGFLYPGVSTFPYTANQTDTVTFTYIITDANGCQAGPYSYYITTSDPLTVDAGLNDSICEGETVELTAVASGGQLDDIGNGLDYHYLWNTGPNDTLASVSVSPSATTDYIITVTDFCQDVVTDTVRVVIFEDPTPIIEGDTSACAPYTSNLVNLNHMPGSTCEWIFSNGATSNDCSGANVVFDIPGCYDVTLNVTSADGCQGSSTAQNVVCINPVPVAQFEYEPIKPVVSDGQIEFTNTSENASLFYWDFERFGFSFERDPVLEFDLQEETIFQVCLDATSAFGCEDDTCQFIIIQDDLLFYVPNAFTPDDGSVNSLFTPIFTSGFDPYEFQLTIYNRWGEIVFLSNNPDVGWDGTYGGYIAEGGVYIWKISFTNQFDGENMIETGHVTLLR